MKRILKRYLALLLVALLVITGTPMASFAAETPSITNFVGKATGATSGEFTWDFDLPSGYEIDNVTATLNGSPVSVDLSTGIYSISDLDPITTYTLSLIANLYSTESLVFTVNAETVSKSTTDIIEIDDFYIYIKNIKQNGTDKLYYEHSQSHDNNPPYNNLGDLVDKIYGDLYPGYELNLSKVPELEENSGWDRYKISGVEYTKTINSTETKYFINDEEFVSYDDAKKHILSDESYIFNNEDNDFNDNDERQFTVTRKIPYSLDKIEAAFTTNAIPKYDLNIILGGEGEGEVTVNPVSEGNQYEAGTEVTLTATSSPDSTFKGWSGDAEGTSTSISVTMDSNKSITAIFEEIVNPVKYSLEVGKTGEGSVSPVNGTYDEGTSVTITAEPKEGWEFIGWSGNETGKTNPLTITMDSHKNITATFGKILDLNDIFVLTVGTIGEGTVNSVNGSYGEGTSVTITATPDVGWEFLDWSGDETGKTNPLTITMDSHKNITATFVKIPDLKDIFVLTVGTIGEGTVNSVNGSYGEGTSVTITATPEVGWEFIGWSGDETGKTNPLTITMNSHKNITAKFEEMVVPDEKATFTLTAGKVGQGSVSPDNGTYDEGTSVTITAIPEPGWEFTGWSGDSEDTSASITVTMDSDKTVTATFTKKVVVNPPIDDKDVFTLAVEKEGQGTVTPASGTYDEGTSVTVTATPESGWTFTGWSGDVVDTSNSITVTMDNNKNITATFTRVQVTTDENNDDDDEELEEIEIPAATPQVNEPLTIVDLGEDEELPGGPAIVEEKEKESKEEKENKPEEELITLDIPAEAIPEGSGLPQTGQLPVELFVGLGGLITATGVFLKRKQ